MRKDQRVSTPQGPGTVAYVRMAAPAYATIEAVSVVLDSKQHRPHYAGTVYPAADVTPLPEAP